MLHARKDYNERVQDSAHIIPEDEPVFLLRAKDFHALATVDFWACKVEDKDPELANHIRRHAKKMREWQKEHAVAFPDTPPEELLV